MQCATTKAPGRLGKILILMHNLVQPCKNSDWRNVKRLLSYPMVPRNLIRV
jgi:hypothetical protein